MPKNDYQEDKNNFLQFLKKIGKVPLLTREEEILYGRSIKALQELVKQHKEQKLIGIERDSEQIKRVIIEGLRAKEMMTISNLRLVVSIAKRYSAPGLDWFDLVQAGIQDGLKKAVEKFDPEKGYKLSTYTVWWVRQAITKEIAKSSRLIRVPTYIHHMQSRLSKKKKELELKLDRRPTTEEIIKALIEGNDPKEQKKLRREALLTQKHDHSVRSSDAVINDDEDVRLIDTVADKHDSWASCEQVEKIEIINEILAKLSPRESLIIQKRFGLDGNKPCTLKELEGELGISRERVRQIQSKALKKLKSMLPDEFDYAN